VNGLVHGERPTLTRWERALRVAAAGLAAISLTFAVIYFVIGVFGDAEFPYATNSVAKDVLLTAIALLVVWDVRRWAAVAVPLIVATHVAMPIVLLATLHGAHDTLAHTWILSGTPFELLEGPAARFRWTWLGLDLLIVALFQALHFLAIRSRYDMRYLTPSGFRALMALAEVLVLVDDRAVAPAEVAVRVDHYLARFRARGKNMIRLAFLGLAFWPLLTARPPFHVMSPHMRRRFVERRFLDETRDWLMPAWLRNVRRAMIRTAQQFCFMGYYGDEGAAERAGYRPYSRRDDAAAHARNGDPGLRHDGRAQRRLTCLGPADISGETLEADVVVVGTGAAGAMLAHELVVRGRSVLMLERGRHVETSAFTEDEAVQLSELYADGALTLSKDFRFQVAQGMCVGGSTVVNNAVCFDLPDHVRDRWLGDELEAGLDEDRLKAAFDHVRRFLGVAALDPLGIRSPGGEYVAAALNRLHGYPYRLSVAECNIAGCRGTGYCNIGCPFGAKLSALDWTLPEAQRKHPDRLRILPDSPVDKVLMRDKRRAYGVRARLSDGRRLTVRAQTVVLSAGAIASSLILQRSGLGEGRAGNGLAFNMASPVTLDFDKRLHSERGAQIAHYLEPTTGGGHEGIAIESWFNPIVTQSLFMPGWFEEHWRNMRRYAHMTCLGVVVGSESTGKVRATRTGGVKLDYVPTDRDFVKLKRGVRLACEIGLDVCAIRVMPSTFHSLPITSRRELTRIDTDIGSPEDISINSSHPQGGNPISRNSKKGVVDSQFRVYGTENVHVCDASVFPSSITVNPQLTVMALAAYAAHEIADPPCAPQPAVLTSHAQPSGPGS
jgi:choline dehydrogenase-like flavoprotein